MTDTATKAGPLLVRTILLLPNADTRERLLAPHAPSCRRVAPGATLSWGTLVGEPGDVRHHVAHAGSCPVDEHVHLVLAREGAVVPEGVDRLRRVALSTDGAYTPTDLDVRALLAGNVVLGRAQWLSRMQELGTLVLLDADGKEVPCV